MPALPVLLLDVSHDFTNWLEELSKWTQVPVGLAWISASLRQAFSPAELNLKVLDVATLPGYFAKVHEVLRDLRPRLVGIRGISLNAKQVHSAAQAVKEWNRDALVVAGGPYAASSPDLLLADPNIDAVCPGEGEHVMIDVVRRVREGQTDLRGIQGLHCRFGGQIHKAEPAPWIQDLDSLPFPDYSDLDLSWYWGKHPHTAVGRPYASLVASRGCPYGCIFCHAIFGQKMRFRSPGNIAAEVRQLHDRHGIRDFILADDGFNINLPWAKDVLRAIVALDIKPRIFFSNGLRGDIWDEEFLDLLVAAGTAELWYAVESASPRIQKLLRKRLDIPRVEEAIIATAKRGIITNGFFMVGIPSETKEEVEMTVDFIVRHLDQLDFAFLAVMRAYQGTPAYDVARELGYSEEFLVAHATMPFCMQVRVASEHNFIPYELLKWARMEVALRQYSPPRMKRVLADLRRHLDEEEIIMKFATFMSTTKGAARDLVRRYDQGAFDAKAAAHG